MGDQRWPIVRVSVDERSLQKLHYKVIRSGLHTEQAGGTCRICAWAFGRKLKLLPSMRIARLQTEVEFVEQFHKDYEVIVTFGDDAVLRKLSFLVAPASPRFGSHDDFMSIAVVLR